MITTTRKLETLANQLPIIERLGPGVLMGKRMSPPPAEKLGYVLQHELTMGCSYNRCGYCSTYRGMKYQARSPEEFETHVDLTWDRIFQTTDFGFRADLKRLFIGSGNALTLDTQRLFHAINYSIESFIKNTGRRPSRVAMYGNTRDILAKGEGDLKYLHCGGYCTNCSKERFGGERIGLDVLYWGLESGSTKVLKKAHNGVDKNDQMNAARILNDEFRPRVSAMVMPGLGGFALSDEHVRDTVEVLNTLRPAFITFIGTRADQDTRYARKIEKEEIRGENRNLTNKELVEQTARIIDSIDAFPALIGVHGPEVHSYGLNPVPIGSNEVKNWGDQRRIARKLRRKARRIFN